MNGASRRRPGTDPLLLVEAGLVIVLLALFVFLYIVPTENRLSNLSWWSPVLLGGASLGVLLLDAWRRKRRDRREMREMTNEQLGSGS